jgi:hypothetical protein
MMMRTILGGCLRTGIDFMSQDSSSLKGKMLLKVDGVSRDWSSSKGLVCVVCYLCLCGWDEGSAAKSNVHGLIGILGLIVEQQSQFI